MRVLLVEDEPLWQKAVSQLVTTLPGWSVVATANSYEAAMVAYDTHNPDVVLLDWNIIGDKDGAAVGNAIMALGHSPSYMAMVSGADSIMLPETPYEKISKSKMATDLIPALNRMKPNK